MRREAPPVRTPHDVLVEELRVIGNKTALDVLSVATGLLEVARKQPSILRDGDELLAKEARRDLERASHILAGIGRRWGVSR